MLDSSMVEDARNDWYREAPESVKPRLRQLWTDAGLEWELEDDA
jgi:hypothetical protein